MVIEFARATWRSLAGSKKRRTPRVGPRLRPVLAAFGVLMALLASSAALAQTAPTVTGVSPTTGSTLGGGTVTLSGTDFAGATGVSFGATAATGFTVVNPTTITATAPAHAAGTVNVTVTTADGTSAAAPANQYTFETPPSAPTVTLPANGSRTNIDTPTYSGTAGNNLTITVTVDGGAIGTTLSNGGGSWSLIQPSPLADGAHTVNARASSATGVESPVSNTPGFIIDTAAPSAPTVTAPVSGSTTNDTTPTFTGTAEANSIVRVFIGGSFSGSVTPTGTNWTYTPTSLADATYSFWTTATDVAGNLSPQSPTGSLTVDTVAPPTPVITAPLAGADTSATPTISGTAEANATVSVTVDAATVTTSADGAGAWSLVWTTLAAGSHTVTATARDAALNTSGTTAPRSFTVIAPPVASSFTYGSIVPYNPGGDPPTTFSVAGSVTGGPTSYAVGSATTSGGGSVSIDNAGLVSFTPAVGRRGNDSFTYTASNAGGASAPATVTVTVGNPTFAIALAGSGTRGSPLSGVQINVTGGAAPYACGTSVASGALPAGVALNDDCTLTGTPSASGTFTFTVTVVDSSTGVGPFTQTSSSLSLTIAEPAAPVLTAFTAGAVGYGSSGNAINVAAGTSATNSPTAWMVSKDGVAFAASAQSANSGAANVSITNAGVAAYAAPTGFRGNDVFYVRASNPGGDSNVVAVTVPVNNPTLSISLAGSGAQGAALSGVPINTTGGASPYSCATAPASGALPAGTQLNADCTITGTPTANGTFTFTVSVTDSSTGVGPFTQTSGSLSLTIAAPAAPALTAFTAGAVGYGSSGNSIDVAAGTSAANSPTAWVVSKDGVAFAASAQSANSAAANVSITNAGVASYAAPAGFRGDDVFYVRASNAGGNSNVVAVTVPVNTPTLATSLVGSGAQGVALSGVEIVASGGATPYSCATALASGALPAGTQLNADCTITGTPTVSGTFTFTVSVTDSSTGLGPVTQTSGLLSLTIAAPPPVPAIPTMTEWAMLLLGLALAAAGMVSQRRRFTA